MEIRNILKAPIRWELALHNEIVKRKLYAIKDKPVSEYLAANDVPELSLSDKRIISEYWKQYGIRIRDFSWFRWFSYVYGEVSPRFIPSAIYGYIIWPYYNKEDFMEAWKDKNYFNRFLPDVPFPHAIAKKISGKYYVSENRCVEREEVERCLLHENIVIVKDAIESGEGRGVKKYSINNKEDVKRLLGDWKTSDNWLAQTVVRQHPFFSQFNESSVNIMRISSFHHNGLVDIIAPCLRIGTPGHVTDLCFIDGVETGRVCGITKDGYLMDEIISCDGKHYKTADVAPNYKTKIPRWDDILTIIKENHPKLGHFDIIGWDFTVDENNQIICIEYNIRRPGTVFYQYCHGPFFGTYTEEVLSFLKNPENQRKCIPSYYRI